MLLLELLALTGIPHPECATLQQLTEKLTVEGHRGPNLGLGAFDQLPKAARRMIGGCFAAPEARPSANEVLIGLEDEPPPLAPPPFLPSPALAPAAPHSSTPGYVAGGVAAPPSSSSSRGGGAMPSSSSSSSSHHSHPEELERKGGRRPSRDERGGHERGKRPAVREPRHQAPAPPPAEDKSRGGRAPSPGGRGGGLGRVMRAALHRAHPEPSAKQQPQSAPREPPPAPPLPPPPPFASGAARLSHSPAKPRDMPAAAREGVNDEPPPPPPRQKR